MLLRGDVHNYAVAIGAVLAGALAFVVNARLQGWGHALQAGPSDPNPMEPKAQQLCLKSPPAISVPSATLTNCQSIALIQYVRLTRVRTDQNAFYKLRVWPIPCNDITWNCQGCREAAQEIPLPQLPHIPAFVRRSSVWQYTTWMV